MGVAARDRRWASRSIGVAVLFLLVFNAVSPLNWARQQPPGWVQATVEKVSTAWVDRFSLGDLRERATQIGIVDVGLAGLFGEVLRPDGFNAARLHVT